MKNEIERKFFVKQIPDLSAITALHYERYFLERGNGKEIRILQTIIGGNITLFTSLCERARIDAFERMSTGAAEMGANAIIGVRYDATGVGSGVTEVLAYGTAVVVEKA